MTNEPIQADDRVRWNHRVNRHGTPRFEAWTGRVESVSITKYDSYASVMTDGGQRRLVSLDKLVCVEAEGAAPGDLRRAVDDYDEAMALANAGSIGSGVDW